MFAVLVEGGWREESARERGTYDRFRCLGAGSRDGGAGEELGCCVGAVVLFEGFHFETAAGIPKLPCWTAA